MGIVGQVIILAVVQGLTELLPVSSSAHLILVPWLLGWQQLGLIFDVSLHAGTLLAILVYFRRDWISILAELPLLLQGKLPWGRSRTLVLLLGTLPAAVFGLASRNFIESQMRTPLVIVVCLIAFALLLWVAEVLGAQVRAMEDIRPADGLWIGAFQALALIPGVSRSGVTITAGLLRNFRAWDAARVSFLLSAPAIAGATVWEAGEAYREYLKGPMSVDPLMGQSHPFLLLLLGISVSALVGTLCIRYFLRYLQIGTLIPFVIYRIVLGLAILAAVATGMPLSSSYF
ncbi:MAG: undecaprenyl-diphosphate phosphatase [Acidobacteria bacterium]|nr:undecaprenyl-diphosphate phosphatase [Acidobacteriota bacterium]